MLGISLSALLLTCLGAVQAQQTMELLTSITSSCTTQTPVATAALASTWVNSRVTNTAISTITSTVVPTSGVLTLTVPQWTYALATVTSGTMTTTSLVVATTTSTVTKLSTVACPATCVMPVTTCVAPTVLSKQARDEEPVLRARTAGPSLVATATFSIDCTVNTVATLLTTIGSYTSLSITRPTSTQTSTEWIPTATTTLHLTAFVTTSTTTTVKTSSCKVCTTSTKSTSTKSPAHSTAR